MVGPSPFDFHHIERHPLEEVLKGGADPYAVAVQGLKTSCACSCSDPLQELLLGKRWCVCFDW